MINVRQGVFHLRNEEASYLFRVKDGFLEHLHFGARAETADALAFAARHVEVALVLAICAVAVACALSYGISVRLLRRARA